jgi:hypothetical protein
MTFRALVRAMKRTTLTIALAFAAVVAADARPGLKPYLKPYPIPAPAQQYSATATATPQTGRVAAVTAPGGLSSEKVEALAEVYLRQAQNLRLLAVLFPEGRDNLNGQALSFERAAEMLLEAAR